MRQITKKELRLKVPEGTYLPGIQNTIKENLDRMGVDGLTVDLRYDVRGNIALCRFKFKGKNYEMKVSNQKDVRANMYAIAKRVEWKARMHLLDIESFDVSVSPYLMIEGTVDSNYQEPQKANSKSYAVLGMAEYSSNTEIEKQYKHLVKTFHPDMALSSEAKQEFQKRMAEINQAWTEIKNERGI